MIELPLSFDLDEGPELLFKKDWKYNSEQFVNVLQDSLPIKVVAGTRCIAKATNFEIEGNKLMFWVKGPEEELQKLKASNCELAPAWIIGNKDKPFRKIVELNPGPLKVGWNEEVKILGPEKKTFDPSKVKVFVDGEEITGFSEIEARGKLRDEDLIDVDAATRLLEDMGERVAQELDNQVITRKTVIYEIQKAADEIKDKLEVELPFVPEDSKYLDEDKPGIHIDITTDQDLAPVIIENSLINGVCNVEEFCRELKELMDKYDVGEIKASETEFIKNNEDLFANGVDFISKQASGTDEEMED